MDALGQDVDPHADNEVAPQRGGEPEAVVAEATRVEADDQAGAPDPFGQVGDVGRQVGAAALLAGLDEDHHAPSAAVGRHEPGDGGKEGIAVVGGAAPVEEVPLAYRLEGGQPGPPLAQRGLLVHMAVDQDGVTTTAVLDQQDRGAAGQLHDLGGQPRVLFLGPRPEELGRLYHGAPFGPVRVEGRGEAGNSGVLRKGGEDALLPQVVDHRRHATTADWRGRSGPTGRAG